MKKSFMERLSYISDKEIERSTKAKQVKRNRKERIDLYAKSLAEQVKAGKI